MDLSTLTFLDIIIRLLLGLFIGFCIGLTSIGGGILALPALRYFLNLDIAVAVGTTTLYAFLTKIMAVIQHVRLKTIEWPLVLVFLIGAIPGTITTALWVNQKSQSDNAFKGFLEDFIAVTIIFSIFVMIWSIFSSKSNKKLSINFSKKIKLSLSIILGFICGSLVGATSIGGGILVIPILILLFNLKTKQAVGSSIIIAFTMTLFTSIIYAKGGKQDAITALIMSFGSIIGVYIGSKLTVKLPDIILKTIVLILIIIGAIVMITEK